MQFKSVQTKIAVIAGLCLLSAVTVLVIYGLFSARNTQNIVSEQVATLQKETTMDGLKSLAGEQAGKIQEQFDLALDAARTMANTFEVSKQQPLDGKETLQIGRDQVNAVLLNVLKRNKGFNGTYSCWEPNAIDGRDEDFRVNRDGNNLQTGRFTPYWTRDEVVSMYPKSALAWYELGRCQGRGGQDRCPAAGRVRHQCQTPQWRSQGRLVYYPS